MFKHIKRILLVSFLLFIFYYTYQIYQNVWRVLTYRPLVQEVLMESQSTVDEDLVLAMIYTETKGREVDVMQASESDSGLANTITDAHESIRQGVLVLESNLKEASEAGVDQWTAVQAYNYGRQYISYVAKRGGHNTIAVSKAYSRDVVAPSLGNRTGATYRYYHPIALYYGGGELYKDGGNIYYSRQVQFNLKLMSYVKHFFI